MGVQLLVAGFVLVIAAAVAAVQHDKALAANLVISAFAGLLTYWVIPGTKEMLVNARICGIDLNKATTKRDADGQLVRPVEGIKVPEAMGVVSGAMYSLAMSAFLPFAFLATSTENSRRGILTQLLAALLSISNMCFLGFADNVLDLRWRHKLILPSVATLPLLMVYFAEIGVTSVLVPKPFDSWLGITFLDLGPFYYIFLAMLAIFCTNAINILAGVNGLEAGQALVIAMSLIMNDLVCISRIPDGLQGRDHHLFSLYILVPFATTTAGLLYWNWFPSSVFVGDTFCYFAGMTFAVAGILGHYSKTLLLFMIPQIVNWILSMPQVFKIIPCPRHRMPGFIAKDNVLKMSYAEIEAGKVKPLAVPIIKILRLLGLSQVQYLEDGSIKLSNLTLINVVLYWFGPMREDKLTLSLLVIQALCSGLAFVIRYRFVTLIYQAVSY